MAKFTVDTHLFRELGELLVGRDSTALIELIKNAYDADATKVTVYGEQLDNPSQGRIVIADNGIGMDIDTFQKGFLRIASRLREHGERKSVLFNRQYTGAKGIGRLASHKLARKLQVDSVPDASETTSEREAVHAVISWDKIEEYETLDEIDTSNAIIVERTSLRPDAKRGSTLTLSDLRRAWTPKGRAQFLAEIQSFDAPHFLQKPLPSSVITKRMLFAKPVVRNVSNNRVTEGLKFDVELKGDFDGGEEYWQLMAQSAKWVLEIRAARDDVKVCYAISPTKRKRNENSQATDFSTSMPHPDPQNGPWFDARILVREGHFKGTHDQRVWGAQTSGIRVYLEGFRILPYGDKRDDWLSIDADYTRRPRQLELLQEFGFSQERPDADEGLIRLPSNNYFGAVFLTQENSPTLRILVNREGFIPEAGFDELVKIVRIGVDLCTRTRASCELERRTERKQSRFRGQKSAAAPKGNSKDESGTTSQIEPTTLVDQLTQVAEKIGDAQTQIIAGNMEAAKESALIGAEKLKEVKIKAEYVISERGLLWVLASVGTQMAAFVHEINALLGSAQAVERAILRITKSHNLSPKLVRSLKQLSGAVGELRRGLERQSSYLMDIVTPDARRRRSRQYLCRNFNVALRLVQNHAERRHITIENQIPKKLKSPPMFPAEIMIVFANLLTNAVKAAGRGGRIHAFVPKGDENVRIRVENTGVSVDPEEADRWFKPFESTTSEIDPVLGQGMGLGLTITRSVLENYGAKVAFVQPSDGYVASVEVTFPKIGR